MKTAFVVCSAGQGTEVVALGAATAAAAAAVAVAVSAAVAAVAAAVAALWPPATPVALESAERPDEARRAHAVTTLVPPPALVPALLLRCLRLKLMAWGPC